MSNSANLPLKEELFEEIRRKTENDNFLCNHKKVIARGWPEHKSQQQLSQHFSYRDELSIENGIIYKEDRINIPESVRDSMKKNMHAAHTGINSCVRRASQNLGILARNVY